MWGGGATNCGPFDQTAAAEHVSGAVEISAHISFCNSHSAHVFYHARLPLIHFPAHSACSKYNTLV